MRITIADILDGVWIARHPELSGQYYVLHPETSSNHNPLYGFDRNGGASNSLRYIEPYRTIEGLTQSSGFKFAVKHAKYLRLLGPGVCYRGLVMELGNESISS